MPSKDLSEDNEEKRRRLRISNFLKEKPNVLIRQAVEAQTSSLFNYLHYMVTFFCAS